MLDPECDTYSQTPGRYHVIIGISSQIYTYIHIHTYNLLLLRPLYQRNQKPHVTLSFGRKTLKYKIFSE